MKEMYKKWLSIFSVALLVSSFIVSLASPFVGAVSDWDNVHVMDSFASPIDGFCDLSTSYFQTLDDSTIQSEFNEKAKSWVYWFANGIYFLSWSEGSAQLNAVTKDSENGFVFNTGGFATPMHTISLSLSNDGSCAKSNGYASTAYHDDGEPDSNYSFVASDGNKYIWHIGGDVTVNYPPGYEGHVITALQEQVSPRFSVDYSDKSITMKHEKTFDKLPTVDSAYMVEYSVMACSSVDNNSCTLDDSKGTDGLISYKLSKPGQSLSVDVPSHGYYQIQAEYLQTGGDCHSLEYNPDSGGFHTTDPDDYCYFQKPADDSKYTYTSSTLILNVDGSSGSLDTADLQCDSSGTCKMPSKYEDCSVYAPSGVFDWGAFLPWFSCIGRNIAVWVSGFVNSIFRVLFVPDSRFLTDSFTNLKNNLNNHLGVLQYPFAFIGGIVQSMQVNQTCSTTNPNSTMSSLSLGGGFFGKQFNMNMCDFPNHFPSMWNIMVIIINVVTYSGLISAYYAVFLQLFGKEKRMEAKSQ